MRLLNAIVNVVGVTAVGILAFKALKKGTVEVTFTNNDGQQKNWRI